MAGPEFPISPQIVAEIPMQLQMLVETQRGTEAATLAAAIIAAMGRPVSVAEALEIHQDLEFSLYPGRQSVRYQEWRKTQEERLAKVRT